MPRSIRQFIIMVVAIGMAVVGATAIGIAAAQSAFEQAKKDHLSHQFAGFGD